MRSLIQPSWRWMYAAVFWQKEEIYQNLDNGTVVH
jgi:hypothetical protein